MCVITLDPIFSNDFLLYISKCRSGKVFESASEFFHIYFVGVMRGGIFIQKLRYLGVSFFHFILL